MIYDPDEEIMMTVQDVILMGLNALNVSLTSQMIEARDDHSIVIALTKGEVKDVHSTVTNLVKGVAKDDHSIVTDLTKEMVRDVPLTEIKPSIEIGKERSTQTENRENLRKEIILKVTDATITNHQEVNRRLNTL